MNAGQGRATHLKCGERAGGGGGAQDLRGGEHRTDADDRLTSDQSRRCAVARRAGTETYWSVASQYYVASTKYSCRVLTLLHLCWGGGGVCTCTAVVNVRWGFDSVWSISSRDTPLPFTKTTKSHVSPPAAAAADRRHHRHHRRHPALPADLTTPDRSLILSTLLSQN